MLVPEVNQNLVLLEFLLAKFAEQPPLFTRFLLLRVFLSKFYQEQLLFSELFLVFLLLTQVLSKVLQGLFENVLVDFVHLGHGRHAPSLFSATPSLFLGAPWSRQAPEHFFHGGQVIELVGGTGTCRKSSRNYSKSPKSPMKVSNYWN